MLLQRKEHPAKRRDRFGDGSGCRTFCAAVIDFPIGVQKHGDLAIQLRCNGGFLVRKVEQSQKRPGSIGAGICENAPVVALAVHPFEAVVGVVQRPEDVLFQIQLVQLLAGVSHHVVINGQERNP